MTSIHPFMDAVSGLWKPVAWLNAGDVVKTKAGIAVLTSKEKLEGTHTVYNFTVNATHNYLIGDEGVVVHNWNCGDIEKHVVHFLNNVTKSLQRVSISAIWAAQKNHGGISYRGNFIEALVGRVVFYLSGYTQTGWSHPVIDFFKTTIGKVNGVARTTTEIISMKSTKATSVSEFLNDAVKSNLVKLQAKTNIKIIINNRIDDIPNTHTIVSKMVIIVENNRLAAAQQWLPTLKSKYPDVNFIINSTEKYLGI